MKQHTRHLPTTAGALAEILAALAVFSIAMPLIPGVSAASTAPTPAGRTIHSRS
jgi:siroheme synthase